MNHRNVLLLLTLLGGCMTEADLSDDDGAAIELSGVEQAFPGRLGEPVSGLVDTLHGVVELDYTIIDGVAVFEGDILLRAADRTGPPGAAPSTGRSDTAYRWVNGIVPYEIDTRFSEAQRAEIISAMDHWNTSTVYWLRPRNGESDYVKFVPGAGCSSYVGRQGGRQDITLAPGCDRGSAIHELGHAVGLWHEQSRADRGQFVDVLWENITVGMEHNFKTYVAAGNDGQDLFDYDFGSIMHYGESAFSSNGNPTLTRVDGKALVTQRTGLSATDIAGATRVLTKNSAATFKLVNANSGHCMDVANASRSPQALVNQATCHGGANQRWYLYTIPWSGKSLVINDRSGHCLDIPNASLANGVQLQQYPCHGVGNQQFWVMWITAGHRLQVDHSGKCLDVPGGSLVSGTRINQFTCNTGLNQRWNIVW